MANIPLTGGGNVSEHKIWCVPSSGKKVEFPVDPKAKGLKITVKSNLDNNREASFTLPLGASWEFTIEEST